MELDFLIKRIKKKLASCDFLLPRHIFLFLILTLLFGASHPAYSQDIIANASDSQTMTRNTLRSIYSMRLQTWPDGKNITVFILDPQGERHRQFCLEILNIFPYQLQRVWDVLIFSGTGQYPVVVDSEKEMMKQIKSTPGAIGYIIDSEVPFDVNKIIIN